MRIIFCTIFFFFIQATVFAQKDISQLLSALKSEQSDSEKINTYVEIYSYYMFSNTDSAFFYTNNALQYFAQKNDKMGQAQMLNMLAKLNENEGKMDLAEQQYLSALRFYTATGYNKGIAGIQDNIGEVEGKKGNYNDAIKYFMQSLRLSEQHADTNRIIENYMKLGVVSEKMNDLDKALRYYSYAEDIQKGRTTDLISVTLYNNIGVIYGKREDYKNALTNFQQAIKLNGSTRFPDVHAMSYMDAGIAYGHLGDKTHAMESFDTALDIAAKQHIPEVHARILINLANLIFDSEPVKATTLLRQALDEARSGGMKELESDIYYALVEAYSAQEDYKNAFATLQQEQSLNDSLFTIEKDKEVANLQAVYDLDKSKVKIQALDMLNHKTAREKGILMVVGLMVVVILIVLMVYYRKTIKLNEQLIKQRESLKSLNDVKDKLFSIIGHDLRGPIANILVMLQIYEDESTPAQEKHYIFEQLKEHVQASTETLDKLLYWGQSQIKGTTLHQVVFETKEYITRALHLLKSIAEQKHITIEDKTPHDLKVNADPAHFDFVIRNLLSNAVKFTHSSGAIEVLADNDKLPGFVVYAVRDNGVGVPAESQKNIFEPLNSSKNGTANEKGTSIGLMLCRDFITANGGSIWVESEEGKGATFYFSLKTV